jgi:hypothetical protein
MADLPSTSQIIDLVNLLAPGLIIASIRTRAITGSLPDLKDRLTAYAVISVGYLAAVSPFFHVEGGIRLIGWLWSILHFFFVPVVLGLVLAYVHQHQLAYRVASIIGLRLAHHLPSSWDYRFESLPASTFLLVTLSDGTQVAGKWAHGSFASSSREERDLLLAEVWEVPSDGSAWKQVQPLRSVLICGKDVRLVEFFNVEV